MKELYGALTRAQLELKNPRKGSSGYGYKYANLPELLDIVKPILEKHNLCLIQMPVGSDGEVGIKTILAHISGQYEESTIKMAVPKLAKMSEPQAAGSVITYLRRYALQGFLNIFAEERDTDCADLVQPSAKSNSVSAKIVDYKETKAAAKSSVKAKASAQNNDADGKAPFIKAINEELKRLTKTWSYTDALRGYYDTMGIKDNKELATKKVSELQGFLADLKKL